MKLTRNQCQNIVWLAEYRNVAPVELSKRLGYEHPEPVGRIFRCAKEEAVLCAELERTLHGISFALDGPLNAHHFSATRDQFAQAVKDADAAREYLALCRMRNTLREAEEKRSIWFYIKSLFGKAA